MFPSNQELTNPCEPQEARRKGGGHEQMLGQAAAVLVSLSTLVAFKVTAGFLITAYDVLPFTGSPITRLLEA